MDVARSGDVVAWLGPAIGARAFEVGADLHSGFCKADPLAEASFTPVREGKWLADLYALARARLERAGVSSVGGGGWCTHGDAARFFSFRRDGETGRMAALVWLEPRATL
jgi:copper oxidase (laccase) domain-containing protein